MNSKHEAYYKAVEADRKWSAELQKVYGRQAGDARYDKRGKATPELERLYWEFQEAVTDMHVANLK